MKKSLLSLAAFLLSLFAWQSASTQNVNPSGIIRCGTDEYLEWMKQQDPGLEARMQKIEDDTQAWINSNRKNPKAQSTVVTIPTVVHVIYKTAGENISDTYIQQQIDIINKDFRKLNSDWTKINTANPNWASLVADCEIEFCLASKDPSGAATTGIIHKQTTITEFTGSADSRMKFTAQGGSDIWDRNKYLNIWVVNFGSSGLLGYAQLPGSTATTDGVCVMYSSLPGAPYCCSPNNYDLGRSATHEIGHWLNLQHTFQGGCSGLTSSNCATAGDYVCDTPPIAAPIYECPTTLARNTCTETSPFPPPFTSDQPNMWMNYMDYTDDPCMYMFTTGQKTRMTATLNGVRASLQTSAATNCGVVGVNELALSQYVSVYPNPSAGNFSLTINIPNISAADMVIYNAIGEAVLTRRLTITSGNDIEVDMNKNPDGIYLIKLKTTEGTITKKVVISR